MSNPLIQIMGSGSSNSSPGLGNLGNIVRMLQSGNPEQIASSLMQRNPQFKAFMDANRGKTPEQFAKEHGIDLEQLMDKI